MTFRCVGCNSVIPWDGKGLFSYACRCGGHIFFDDESGKMSCPALVVIAINRKRGIPHIDYLIGGSAYNSVLKETVIQNLITLGSIWMKDCRQCLEDGTYQKYLDMDKELAIREVERILNKQNDNSE